MSSPQQKYVPLLVLGIVLAVGLVSYLVSKNQYFTDRNARYAIFLTNGQVYIGQVKAQNRESLTLTRVYFPRDVESLKVTGSKKISLIKLSDEPYRPEDTIIINRSHMAYMTPIQADSKVTEAITKAEEATPSPVPTSTETSTATASPNP